MRVGARGWSSAAWLRVAQVGVVHEPAPHRPDEIERAGDDDRARAVAERLVQRRGRVGGDDRVGRSPAPAAAPAPRQASSAGQRPRQVDGRAHDPRVARATGPAASAAMTPSTSLSAIDAVTSVSGPVREERAQVVERRREGGGAGRVVRAVEQHLAAADVAGARGGPARRRSRSRVRRAASRRPWRCRRPRARRAARRRRRRSPPGAGRAGRPASGRAAAARPRSRRGPSRGAAPARPRSAARPCAARVGGRPRAPRRVAPVTARSPRSMIAAFSRAICRDRRRRAGPCGRGRRS